MTVAVGTITVFALFIGGWLFFHRNAPKTTVLLFLIAGFGIGGVAGAWLGRALDTVIGLAGSVTGRLLGVGVGALIAAVAVVLTLEVVVKGMWFKKAKPKRYHPWLALALPTVVVAAGVPLLTELTNAFGQAVASVGSALG